MHETIEARNLQRLLDATTHRIRLAGIEGITFSEPLAIEQVRETIQDDLHLIEVSVWHDQHWMFGMSFVDDDRLLIEMLDPDTQVPSGIFQVTSREGKIRVHGTWHTPDTTWSTAHYPI